MLVEVRSCPSDILDLLSSCLYVLRIEIDCLGIIDLLLEHRRHTDTLLRSLAGHWCRLRKQGSHDRVGRWLLLLEIVDLLIHIE